MVTGKLNTSVTFVCDLIIFLPVVFQPYINYGLLCLGQEDRTVAIFFSSFISVLRALSFDAFLKQL